MTLLYATYCSANKSSVREPLPASQRYLSSRIDHLHSQARQVGADAAILSGRFGLVAMDEPIPWYDHLLQENEIAEMTARVSETLQRWETAEVLWLTAAAHTDPHLARYQCVMQRACQATGIRFEPAEWAP